MVRETRESRQHWRRVGAVGPRALVEPRLLLHHAAQLVAAPGRSLLPPLPDDAQTAFTWIGGEDVLAGEWIETPKGRTRVALEPATAGLLLLGRTADVVVRWDLAGRTLDAAFDWLRDALAARGIDASRLSRTVPYDLPRHAVAEGAPFPSTPLPGLPELTRYFADAHRLLGPIVAGRDGASPLRCWPHHLDLATLVTVGKGDSSSSIGVGLSPGDETYPEPYFYVTVSPAPAGSDPLPTLPSGGHWRRGEWFGAALTGTRLAEALDAEEQEARARDFLDAAFRTGLDVAGRAGPGRP
jgi:hypothetical protein